MHGYELIGEWINCSYGKIVKATRKGRTFFIKKYQIPIKPEISNVLDTKTFDHQTLVFDEFVANRKKINSSLRAISGIINNNYLWCNNKTKTYIRRK